MSKEDYAIIDTKVWTPIQSPGLRPAKQKVGYDSPEIQKVLSEAFGLMFPCIVEDDKKQKRYQSCKENGTDIFPKAVPVKNINDIPRAEMMRLMEGWIRLRRKLQDEQHTNDVASILLNFRVPNPRQSLDRYMLYKSGEDVRLIVRWGYETKEEKAVSLERAISILMDVPLGHMRSILSTTMSANNTSTVPVGPLLQAAEAREKADRDFESKKKGKLIGGIAAGVVALLAIGGGALALLGNDKEEAVVAVNAQPAPQATVAQQPAVQPVAQPVQAPVRAAAVEETPEEQEVAAVPSAREMMNDLVAENAKPTSSQKVMSLDAMIQSDEAPEAQRKDMLKDMMN